MKNLLSKLGKKKERFPTDNVPRPMAEINKEYAELLGKCGQTQYLIHVYGQQLANDNKRLVAVNEEASKRQNLDREAAAAEAAKAKAAEGTKENANA